SPGVSWRLTRAARHPLDPPAIAQLLGRGNWLISKVRMSGPDRTRNAIDLVAATVDALAGIVEHAIFGVDLVDGPAPTRGVVFTEDLVKIAGQQGRYAVRHGLSPLDIECGDSGLLMSRHATCWLPRQSFYLDSGRLRARSRSAGESHRRR